MFPPMLLLEPDAAAAMLDYRWQRRAAAAQLAADCGRLNAAYCQPGYSASGFALRFPWESALSGHELQYDGDGRIGRWGKFEAHISGDIALAARQYFYAKADHAWLAAIGFPLVRGVAAFYASRVSKAADGASFGIHGVMGPDEYAFGEAINNSAYTNSVARLTLEAAAELAPLVGESVPAGWAAIATGLEPRLAPVPVSRAPTTAAAAAAAQYHPEYDAYPNMPGTQGEKVKQADTVMLQFPLNVPMDRSVARNDLLWYEPVTDPGGPAMTWAIFAIDWIRLGNWTQGAALFERAYANNVRAPFFVWRETLDGGCTPFLTGAGGFLMAVLFGALGLDVRADRLAIAAPPPSVAGANVTSLSVQPLHWRRSQLSIHVTAATVSVALLDAAEGAPALALRGADGAVEPLKAGEAAITLAREGELSIIDA